MANRAPARSLPWWCGTGRARGSLPRPSEPHGRRNVAHQTTTSHRRRAMLAEFKAFLTKSNALALAVGVIIGAATGKVVTALVGDILMPIISFVLPKGDWREAQVPLAH